MSFEAFYGLWLNLDRARFARSVEVARGVGIAQSTDDVPRVYFDSATRTRQQAEDLLYETNMLREAARHQAKM